MNKCCRPVRFFFHPDYVAIILTSSTIAAIRISVYSPLNIIFDATLPFSLPPLSSLFFPLPVQ